MFVYFHMFPGFCGRLLSILASLVEILNVLGLLPFSGVIRIVDCVRSMSSSNPSIFFLSSSSGFISGGTLFFGALFAVDVRE